MNKADLVAKIAQASGQTKKTVEEFLSALVTVTTAALKAGDEVKLAGLGTFKVVHRAARTGINPRTKQPMKIAATNAPVFKVSATLKGAIAG